MTVKIEERTFWSFKTMDGEEKSNIVQHEPCGNIFSAEVLYQTGVCVYCEISQSARIYGATNNQLDPKVAHRA